MAKDPWEILGITRHASLEEAEAAYRRLASLFHPDHLQDMRPDVRSEGERRLVEVTGAIEKIRSGTRRSKPDTVTTAATARNYNAQVRDPGPGGLHADWTGRHAAAVWSALHRAHTVDGPVQQVEWGAYECVLRGVQVRALLGTVLPGDADWRCEPLENPSSAPPADVGWLVDHIDDGTEYIVTAEVF